MTSPNPSPTSWTCVFPPARPPRSYMMDVDPSDVVELPDLRRALPPVEGVAPLIGVPAEAWEPRPADDPTVRVGMVYEYFLMVTPGEEVRAFGRTPCREEHVIVAGLTGEGDRDPVIVCPIVTWAEYSRRQPKLQTEEALREARAGLRPGLLPVLLPREGYHAEAQLFIRLGMHFAVPYRQTARCLPKGPGWIRLREAAIPAFQAAVAQAAARRRGTGGHDPNSGRRELGHVPQFLAR